MSPTVWIPFKTHIVVSKKTDRKSLNSLHNTHRRQQEKQSWMHNVHCAPWHARVYLLFSSFTVMRCDSSVVLRRQTVGVGRQWLPSSLRRHRGHVLDLRKKWMEHERVLALPAGTFDCIDRHARSCAFTSQFAHYASFVLRRSTVGIVWLSMVVAFEFAPTKGICVGPMQQKSVEREWGPDTSYKARWSVLVFDNRYALLDNFIPLYVKQTPSISNLIIHKLTNLYILAQEK